MRNKVWKVGSDLGSGNREWPQHHRTQAEYMEQVLRRLDDQAQIQEYLVEEVRMLRAELGKDGSK